MPRAARPSAAERGEVVAGPLTQGVFGDNDGRCAELLGHIVEAAPPTVMVPSLSRPVPGGKRPSNSSVVTSVWIVTSSACHRVARFVAK